MITSAYTTVICQIEAGKTVPPSCFGDVGEYAYTLAPGEAMTIGASCKSLSSGPSNTWVSCYLLSNDINNPTPVLFAGPYIANAPVGSYGNEVSFPIGTSSEGRVFVVVFAPNTGHGTPPLACRTRQSA